MTFVDWWYAITDPISPGEAYRMKQAEEARQESQEGNVRQLREATRPATQGKGLIGSRLTAPSSVAAEQAAASDKTLLYVAGAALALAAVAYVARR